MCISLKIIYGCPLQEWSDTAPLGKDFWKIASDLANVLRLHGEKDIQCLVDKMKMTVLLISGNISGNGHEEFRQAKEPAYSTEHPEN